MENKLPPTYYKPCIPQEQHLPTQYPTGPCFPTVHWCHEHPQYPIPYWRP